MEKTVSEVLPIGSFIVCSLVMIVCLARGRHHGTAAYRRWRQRYTLEPLGIEQLVWMFVNVCLMTLCLTVPLIVVHTLSLIHI